MARPWGRRRRFFFSVVAVCLGLGILEGGMRLAGFGPLPTSPVTRNQEILYQYTKFRPSRSLIWELVPGWSGREGHGTVTISSQGLREREISLRPPAGRKRILCLGDSVTFGHWVEAWEAFPRRLEETLLGRGEPVQVINAGVPGYSPFQEMTWLHEKGWTYEPDLVVVAFVLNDVVERFSTLAAYGGSHTVLGIDTTATLSPLNRFLHRTAFYHLVVSLLRFHARRREIYSVRRLFEEPLTPAVERAWRITEGELDEMVQASRQHHVPLLLVAFPFRFQISEHLPPKPQHRLASWAAARQVPFLDLTPTFRRLGAGAGFLDHDHPTPRGHQAAAAAIARRLLEDGLLELREDEDDVKGMERKPGKE